MLGCMYKVIRRAITFVLLSDLANAPPSELANVMGYVLCDISRLWLSLHLHILFQIMPGY